MPAKSVKVTKTMKPAAAKAPRAENGRLTGNFVASLQQQFDANPTYRVLQNAITQVSVASITNQRNIVTQADHSFSIKLDDWGVTDQKGSGRCWMFAGLNLFRVGAMKKLKLGGFEFSQNYTMFWDKLEKANYFYEAIIETAGLPTSDRTVAFLLSHPIDDGGQWNMFANIVKKYGVVPKLVMPETESSSSTGAMNGMLIAKLRQGAKVLRDMSAKGSKIDELRKVKAELLTVIHRILCLHLGTPPAKFDWQWTDSKKKLHREVGMTPQAFAKKYINVPIDDYVCLVNDPRKTSPMGATFTVQYLGNIVGGDIVKYLNIDIELMKQIAIRTMKDGEPVWFGCDVGRQMDRGLGLFDAELRDFASVYDDDFRIDKASRLEYADTCMTHAMLFTGVDLVGNKPRRWRVENSWGESGGQKGFYAMNDSWFGEHTFEIAARKKYLPEKLQKALERKPIVLPPWDPMGALAR
jgi:bleomycin hydrolase